MPIACSESCSTPDTGQQPVSKPTCSVGCVPARGRTRESRPSFYGGGRGVNRPSHVRAASRSGSDRDAIRAAPAGQMFLSEIITPVLWPRSRVEVTLHDASHSGPDDKIGTNVQEAVSSYPSCTAGHSDDGFCPNRAAAPVFRPEMINGRCSRAGKRPTPGDWSTYFSRIVLSFPHDYTEALNHRARSYCRVASYRTHYKEERLNHKDRYRGREC